ncbi:MAG: low molecular weight protein-tyrosine-phosphatase [Acidobacteriota bacterium]
MDKPALRILIVCSGNICRSPMAAALARRRLEEAGFSGFCVESGGTLDLEGQPAHPHAQRAVRVRGLSLEEHRSRTLSAAQLDQATHILVMAPEHIREVLFRRPQFQDRIVKLWEFTDKPRRLNRIADPLGQPYKVFAACRDDIDECLRNWIKTLRVES